MYDLLMILVDVFALESGSGFFGYESGWPKNPRSNGFGSVTQTCRCFSRNRVFHACFCLYVIIFIVFKKGEIIKVDRKDFEGRRDGGMD